MAIALLLFVIVIYTVAGDVQRTASDAFLMFHKKLITSNLPHVLRLNPNKTVFDNQTPRSIAGALRDRRLNECLKLKI